MKNVFVVPSGLYEPNVFVFASYTRASASLFPASAELFESFSRSQGDLNSISIADGFVDGFCLGMRIAIEVMEKQL